MVSINTRYTACVPKIGHGLSLHLKFASEYKYIYIYILTVI